MGAVSLHAFGGAVVTISGSHAQGFNSRPGNPCVNGGLLRTGFALVYFAPHASSASTCMRYPRYPALAYQTRPRLKSRHSCLDCPSPRSEPPSSCPIASHRASRCPLLHMSTLQVDLSAAAATKHPLQSSPKAATWTVSRLSGGPHLIGSTRTACMTTQAPSDHTI